MIEKERDAERDDREVVSTAARAGIQDAAAEQRRLVEDVFELRLKLAIETGQPISAVENRLAAEGRVTTNFDGSMFRPAL